ncbi:MAG: CHAT domain-containing tetratricopeptide repeat protein [Blastocatellia bacterium]
MKSPDRPILWWAHCFALLLSAAAYGNAQGLTANVSVLTPGLTLERAIKGGETHQYQITLAAGECVILEVDAAATQVVWEVRGETDRMLMDGEMKNSPRLWLVADQVTTYQLKILPHSPQASAQLYRLRVAEQRPATEADRNLFYAQDSLQRAIHFYGHEDENSLRQAAANARAAAERWDAAGFLRDAAIAYNLQAMSLQRLDDITASLSTYQQALQRFRTIGDQREEANTMNNLAGLLLRVGEAQQALDTLDKLLVARDEIIPALQIGRAHIFAASAYRRLGDLTKARSFLETALQITRSKRGGSYYSMNAEGQALYELGRTCRELGDYRQALAVLQEWFTVIGGNEYLLRVESCKIRKAMADVYFSRGEYEQAQEQYREALAAFQQVGSPFHRAAIRNDLGATALALGRINEARGWYDEALAQGEALANVTVTLPAQIGLARVARRQGDDATALARIEQAVQLIESQRARIVSPDLRATFLASQREAYELQLDLLAQLGEREKSATRRAAAFAASERGRARSLLEMLSANAGQMLTTADSQLAARERDLRQKISLKADQQTRLSGQPETVEQQTRRNNELALLLAEYERLTQQIRQRDPHYAALTEAQPLTPGEIQQQVLDDKTLLLEYALGAERSWLFAVTRTQLHSFPLPPRRVLEQAARDLYALMEAHARPPVFRSITEAQRWREAQQQQFDAIASQLGQMLLAPVRDWLPQKRLLIVPDGALHYVPFAALPEPSLVRRQLSVVKGNAPRLTDNGQRTTDKRQPLIVHHELLTLPSASLLALLRREAAGRGAAGKTLALFADPVFSADDERVARPQARVTAVSDATLPVRREGGFARLSASRQEAEFIRRLAADSESKIALDFDASHSAVTDADLQQYRYVHFATHGVLDSQRPALSALVLSQVDAQGARQNGYLRTLDVFRLRLNAELVALSGCQTALGREISGEGLVGLTRGFMYAGARRVMASLWQVSDVATAELMRRFYQGLLGKRKLSPAAALRAAQLEMMKNPRYSAPWYWAAFTLQGEW